ncbi:efflux RND transporter periplasmic adaptor subunit [Apibacter muscae]|uniref:Efflux RND transporter periplasmic adaptor subunit n=1 Tax=Apibacter muscae TaxID=2509004 RepID=A0A563DGT9_9FLAO|nr:efflux RND transporter periplasmic adaptor subunit [Apibacter muscae]TWP23758.1 efflux RND transporter periplasmic adaptor subunit [Apibacter muscae]TWP29044.1 efflux RND transporter periplasmic adaptor subunit [Apibacter muscae]TWP30375.1 efflux RND transporter periplasmic adaptor subunit [Apibacter muscae]
MNIRIYITLFLSLIIISCSKEKQENHEAVTKENTEIEITPEQIKINNIQIGKPELKSIDSRITVSGVIHALPQNMSSVHSQVDGFIDKVNFITGEYVKKGQVLATLRNPSFIPLQKQFLESYYNMLLNQKDFQRKKSLLAADAISQKAYEQALALYQVSSAEYESLHSELKVLGFSPSTIIKTKTINPILPIISPQNGFIQAEEISPGKQISTADELFKIINQDELHLELNVPSKYASQLFAGQEVEFSLPEIKDTLKGEIHLIGRATNTENNTIQVHVDIKTKLPANDFYEGRFVNASIINKTHPLLTIPRDAVFEENGKKYIFIKNGSKFDKKEIKTGVENSEYVEVLDLDNNQELVTAGTYYLKAGEIESGHSH